MVDWDLLCLGSLCGNENHASPQPITNLSAWNDHGDLGADCASPGILRWIQASASAAQVNPFSGMILFFCAFSADRLLHRQIGDWHAGVEPCGFLALVICLWYVTAQRIIADDTRLISLNDEMRAATRIQKAILPGEPPILENADIAVRYAPMADVAGDLYDFVTSDPCRMGVLVADVMGHGVPAALVASMVKVAVSTRVGTREGRLALSVD